MTSTFTFRGIPVWECESDPGECVSENILTQKLSGSCKLLSNICAPLKSKGRLLSGSILVFNMMIELSLYPAVALMYFFGVMKASREDRVELDDRASVNVFCLFVLAQPLCLVLGGYTGMATYLLTALVSYNFLPWRQTKPPEKAKESKKKKTK